MKIEVDRSKCVGLGLCEAAAPEHLEVADDGRLLVLRDGVEAQELADVEEAVRACPTAALRLIP